MAVLHCSTGVMCAFVNGTASVLIGSCFLLEEGCMQHSKYTHWHCICSAVVSELCVPLLCIKRALCIGQVALYTSGTINRHLLKG